jgi:hypothetical protein
LEKDHRKQVFQCINLFIKGKHKKKIPMEPLIIHDSDSEGEMYEPIKHVATDPKPYQCLELG